MQLIPVLLILLLASPAAAIPLAYTDGTAAQSDGTPTMGTCGSSPSVSGTDGRGIITVGSGVVTSCAMNFSATLGYTPVCVVTPSSALGFGASATTSVLTFVTVSTVGGASIAYRCEKP